MTDRAPTHHSSTRRRFAIAAAVIALSSAGILAVPPSAQAATAGPGYDQPGKPLFHLGGYLTADGSVTYCIDAGKASAIGRVTTDAGKVRQVNGLNEDAMMRLSVLLSRHGATTDPTTAAAVAMAVWSIAGNPAYQAEGGDTFVLNRVPAELRAIVRARAEQYRAETAAYVPVTPLASLTLTIDPAAEDSGFLDVSIVPKTATGAVTLSNGIFLENGKPTRISVANGAHLAIRGTPPPGSTTYRISASGSDFTAPAVPPSAVRLFTTPGSQTLVSAVSAPPVVFSGMATDSRDRLVPPPAAPPTPPAAPPTPPSRPATPAVPPAPAAARPHLPAVSG